MKIPFCTLILLLFLGCSTTKKITGVNYAIGNITEATPFAPDIIATEGNSEFEIAFTPDGRTAYFSRRAPEEKQKIYQTRWQNGQWTQPTLAPFSTDRDEMPSITPNGELFFFGSERSIPGKPNRGNFDMNIWMMKKTATGWSEPEPLPSPINEVQIAEETWPSSNSNFMFALTDDTFYYSTMVRGSDAIQLYQTTYDKGAFTQPVVITGFFDDPQYWIYSPVVSPDGQYLVFNSFGAPGGAGGEDIFVAKRTENGWSKAVAIGAKVNSKDEESNPRFSRDGKYFFFSRAENLGDYEYGEWSLFFLETQYLDMEKLFD